MKRLNASILVVLLAGLAGWFGSRAIMHFDKGLAEGKTARTTTALVVDKQFVTFSSTQNTYTNDEGREVPIEAWRRKSGEYRVLYRISSFDSIPESYRGEVVQAEQKRQQRFGDRFRIVDRRVYDGLSSGAVLKVTYRWAGDGEIEVISTDPN